MSKFGLSLMLTCFLGVGMATMRGETMSVTIQGMCIVLFFFGVAVYVWKED